MTSDETITVNDNHTLVVGIGNPLCGDDGLGAHAIQLLQEKVLPTGVEVEELGTPGWGLVNLLRGWQRVILIDAVHMGGEPGTWQRLDMNQAQFTPGSQAVSLHEPGLAESLALAEAMKLLPDELVLYGVEPACTTPGCNLSPKVRQVVPTLVENILGELWQII